MKKLTLILAMIFSMPLALVAEEKEKTRNCLSMAQIDRIEVLDNQTLLFHMHGDKKFVNNLPYRCPGLKHNAFIHETSLQSYCDLDTITVYDTSIGMRMGACPLGEFEPYVPLDEDKEKE